MKNHEINRRGVANRAVLNPLRNVGWWMSLLLMKWRSPFSDGERLCQNRTQEIFLLKMTKCLMAVLVTGILSTGTVYGAEQSEGDLRPLGGRI